MLATALYAFFFAVGFVFRLSALALAAIVLAGIFIRPMPVGYRRTLNVLAFVLIAASALVGYAYVMEIVLALGSDNPYEGYAFLRARAASPVTDLIHLVHPAFPRLPWAPYWWAYYFMFFANLAPQLFWFPFFRRPIPAFCVASTVAFSMWFDRLVGMLSRLLVHDLPLSVWS